MTAVSKSALAVTLGITKARVSQYVQRGLPVRADGQIDLERAIKWVADNVSPSLNTKKGAGRAASMARESKPPAAKRPAPPCPDVYEAMSGLQNPFDQGAVWMGIELVMRVGQVAAALAVGAGAPMRVAYALEAAMTIGLWGDLENIATRYTDAKAVPIRFGAIMKTDWAALAAQAGEPVDIEGWEAHLRACFGGPGDEAE